MLIRIEFYRYEEDLALFNDREISAEELRNQLIEGEIEEYLGREDNFLEVLASFGWREIVLAGRPQYWYDRDVQCLFGFNEKADKRGKGVIFCGYTQVGPCLNARIKKMAEKRKN